MLSGNKRLNLLARWLCDSKNVWYRLQLCHWWFEVIMNRPLIWLRILTIQFIYGKIALQTECEWNILSIVGLPLFLEGNEKKGWHLWNLVILRKGVCASSCSCGVCWKEYGDKWLWGQCTVLGAGFQRLLAFHVRPQYLMRFVEAIVRTLRDLLLGP